MNYIFKVILLFLSLNSLGQANYKDTLVLPFEKYVDSLETSYRFSIYQTVGEDSIVLTDKWEYFGAIQIYRNQKKVFEYKYIKDKTPMLEIDVFENFMCKVFNGYYIFKIDNRPTINSYYVLRKTETSFEILGETETNSAFIFADVDNDGFFEIGGFKYPVVGTIDSYEERISTYQARFQIYELNENGFKRETELENRFMNLILERMDIPCSGWKYDLVIQKPILEEIVTINSIRKYAELSKNQIFDRELNGISKEELRIMRNEILASYGYKFKSKDLQEYFSKQTWYIPSDDDVVSKLTEIEKYNIQLIKKKESE